jgi:hypothetical protein
LAATGNKKNDSPTIGEIIELAGPLFDKDADAGVLDG